VKKVAGHDSFLLVFAPDEWDAVDRFGKFKYAPLEGNKIFKRGISATSDHLAKFRVLAEIGNELIGGFDLDRQEMNEKGHTHAKYSRQFAAIAECCVNELYAALDGIRDVIYAVYSSIKGVQKKSTSKLFSKAKDNKYGKDFPAELNSLLAESHDNWFLLLRKYRIEFTHGSLGSCRRDDNTGKVSYMHSGLGTEERSLVIDDFVAYINEVYKSTLQLQHNVFEFFYTTLPLEATITLCGFYTGLGYMRSIDPVLPLTRHSGTCLSVDYATPCPIRERCGAYKNTIRIRQEGHEA
jgi:hypothetical protein